MAKAVDERSLWLADEAAIETAPAIARARLALPVLRLTIDIVVILAAVGVALMLRFRLEVLAVSEVEELTVKAHLLASGIWLVAVAAALAWNRLYDEDTLFPGGGEIARAMGSVLQAVAVMSVFVFLTQSFYVSRSWLGMTMALTGIALAGERLVLRARIARARSTGRLQRPAFLVSRDTEEWPEWKEGSSQEFVIVGRHDAASFEALVEGMKGADHDQLKNAAVILRARDFGYDEFWRIVLLAGTRGWTIYVHSPVRSVARDRLAVREVGGHTMVRVGPPTLAGWRAVQKRALDLIGSMVLVVALSPLFIGIAVAVLVTSGAPVLYRQERVGLKGRTFMMMKFRSMKRDAESSSGPVMTTGEDGRRTGIGRFLRRTSMDELPQLLNVLWGHMSLIGPRPERPYFVNGFNESMEWYRFRHRIRPGMTGWAQAHGLRGGTGFDRRIEFDNWYIENWSIALDLKIALRTVVEVVRGSNAN